MDTPRLLADGTRALRTQDLFNVCRGISSAFSVLFQRSVSNVIKLGNQIASCGRHGVRGLGRTPLMGRKGSVWGSGGSHQARLRGVSAPSAPGLRGRRRWRVGWWEGGPDRLACEWNGTRVTSEQYRVCWSWRKPPKADSGGQTRFIIPAQPASWPRSAPVIFRASCFSHFSSLLTFPSNATGVLALLMLSCSSLPQERLLGVYFSLKIVTWVTISSF